jgi:hypothetical protein
MTNSDQQAAEFIGDIVQSRDCIPDLAFGVGVLSSQVVADRVDCDQSDVADLERGLFEPVEITWE